MIQYHGTLPIKQPLEGFINPGLTLGNLETNSFLDQPWLARQRPGSGWTRTR